MRGVFAALVGCLGHFYFEACECECLLSQNVFKVELLVQYGFSTFTFLGSPSGV